MSSSKNTKGSKGELEMSDVEKWKFRRMLKSLQNMKGDGTSLISLTVKAGAQISLASQMLKEEEGTAGNIKSRVNRLSVLSAIASAQYQLKQYSKTPPNGLAVYCGNVFTEEGKPKKINLSFEPPKPITMPIYKCDKQFHTDPLEAIISDHETYGFIIVDGKGCLYALVNGNQKRILSSFSVSLPGKTRRGGQSALRFSRLREEAIHNYIRKIGEGATQHFIENDMPNVAGIILAGSADKKSELEKSDLLDPRLKKIVINRVDISYGGLMGLEQAIRASEHCLSNLQLVKEKKVLLNYMDHIAKDTGLYCFGIKDTMNALEAGALETMIIWEDLPHKRIKYRYLGDEQVEYVTDLSTLKADEIKEEDNLAEWIAEHYGEYSIKLDIVSDRTAEGSQFAKGFGGIGGILRWKIDLAGLNPEIDIGDDDDFDFDDLEDIM